MAEKKAPAKKAVKPKAKPEAKSKFKPDVLIVIGAKVKVDSVPGVQVWNLKGGEVTEEGDRRAVASLTSQDLYALGWVRRKY